MERIEANKKMIGKSVLVMDESGEWLGEVVGVKDADTFLVRNDTQTVEVDIYDIRSAP